jgi:uncharacterized protein
MTHIQFIQNQTNIAPKSIEATIKLLSEDCTIPFISRYRKDQTGNLDEVQIEAISKLNKQFDEIIKRKESILKSIEEQNTLTPELKSKIEAYYRGEKVKFEKSIHIFMKEVKIALKAHQLQLKYA